ncbi:hypothetical protein [Nitrosomonas sp.]|uniref:hypothetical protein n=1 Tax=Nitrosomonas sp. TaxID=42353 RepID=UPI0025E24622|nr:hypothetical protein [Nitrosomonas sp.]
MSGVENSAAVELPFIRNAEILAGHGFRENVAAWRQIPEGAGKWARAKFPRIGMGASWLNLKKCRIMTFPKVDSSRT